MGVKMTTIIRISSDRTYFVDERGRFSYTHEDGYHCDPSDDWRLTGAIEYGRGCIGIVKRHTFEDIVNNRVPWFYKNGKQRCFVRDFDHGSRRVWMNPPLTSVWTVNGYHDRHNARH